jgi:DNA-binding transcriptional LysR family regulator
VVRTTAMAASPDEIVSMVVFARVVQTGSFTAAAAKLGVSKSVVSERLSALEDQLKVKLLHRTTRKLALTPDGAGLYERCAAIVTAADEAAAVAAGAGDAPRGVLRVEAPIVFAQEYMAEPLAAYLDRFPDVRVELTMRDRMIDLVEEGVDLAIRIAERPQGTGLVARKLAADRTVLCASPEYLARRGTPRAPADLEQHDCLIYSLLNVTAEWRFDEGDAAAPPATALARGRFTAASGAMLRRAALAGMGLAVLPRFMVADDLAAGRLRAVVDSFRGVELGIYAVYPQARRVPSKVRELVDLLVTHFRTPPWHERPAPPRPRSAGRPKARRSP